MRRQNKLSYFSCEQQSTGGAAKRRKNIGFQPEIKEKIRIIRIIDSFSRGGEKNNLDTSQKVD